MPPVLDIRKNSGKKFGNGREVADNIVKNDQDAEESVSDTYMKTWDTIPPQRPQFLQYPKSGYYGAGALGKWEEGLLKGRKMGTVHRRFGVEILRF